MLLCSAGCILLVYIAATPVYEYSDPSEAEIIKHNFPLGGAALQMLLLMMLFVLLPLLLLLSLRFGARRASDGVVLQLRCCWDVGLVWRQYYCSFHTYIQPVLSSTHMLSYSSCVPKHQNPSPKAPKSVCIYFVSCEQPLDQLPLQENSAAKQVYEPMVY